MWRAFICVAAAIGIEIPALVDEEVLEPSIQNEVDHALSIAPVDAPPCEATPEMLEALLKSPTNNLDKTSLAIKLVSSQNSSGRWICGTNDLTRAAIQILSSL